MNEKQLEHIFIIDPLEKLVIKKDSTLMLGLTAKEMGIESYFAFEKDLFLLNRKQEGLRVYDFEGSFEANSFYLKELSLTKERVVNLKPNHCLHMRLEPPFDTRYLRVLWLLNYLKKSGVKIINDPTGIMVTNEKIAAFEHESSIETFIGPSEEKFISFIEEIRKKGYHEIIMKPLDLFQGIGVEKIDIEKHSTESLIEKFTGKLKDYKGLIVVQPFLKEVYEGEIRSVFYDGKELGSIIKTPRKGEYLANIAQGATFSEYQLNAIQKEICLSVCENLKTLGLKWIAFDILGNYLSEVNVTCPGLLVEVSQMKNKNLAIDILKSLNK